MASKSSQSGSRGLFLFAAIALILAMNAGTFAQDAPPSPRPPDLILRNARVYTDHYAQRTWSQALSVRDGVILSIGSNQAIAKERGPSTKVIDLKRMVVLPGFNDAQSYWVDGALQLSRLDVTGAASIVQLQDRIRAYANSNPQKPWILGRGWNQFDFPSQKIPTREDLDAAILERPIVLFHFDQQMALLNTRALDLLKINRDTPNPVGGQIVRNDHGDPTGLMIGSAAQAVSRQIEKPTTGELKQAILNYQKLAASRGITSVQGGPYVSEEALKALEELSKAGELQLRVSIWGSLDRMAEFLELRKRFKDLPEEWVRFDTLEAYVDGTLATQTAALLEPYQDEARVKGEPYLSQDKLTEGVLDANRQGFAVALHAAGDRAVSMALTAFSTARRRLFNSRVRNRIVDAELTPAFAFGKFAENSILINALPNAALSNAEAQKILEKRLGPKRLKEAFSWRSFLSAGARLSFGTHWPIGALNPMEALFEATTRQTLGPNGKLGKVWQPPQKLNLDQAIEAWTLAPAFATREDHVKGTLREGKFADIVVLAKNPFSTRAAEISKIPVYMTLIAGKVAYDGSMPTLQPADAPVTTGTGP